MANITGSVISLRRKTESVTTRINWKTERSQSTVKVCDANGDGDGDGDGGRRNHLVLV